MMGSLFLTGCSGLPFADRFTLDKEQRTKKNEQKQLAAIAARPEVPPSTLLNAGIQNINKGRAKNAQKAFGALNTQHPFSKEAQQSLVLSAYTHFTEKEYADSVSKAEQFIQLYPGSDDAPYMQYLIGESYFQQVNAVVLDQSDTAKGLRAYKDLVRLYPDSKYVPDARGKILFMEDQLAGKEMQIGRYYQERRQHLAAVNRFKGVVEAYDKTRHVEEGLFRLTESYLALGLVNDAKESASLLGHNFPDSDWYQSAFKLVSGDKVKPNKSAIKKDIKQEEAIKNAEAEAVSSTEGVSKRGAFSRLNPFGGKEEKQENL